MIVLVESNMNSFLMISGQIKESKRREFEQTFRLASSAITRNCVTHHLTTDSTKEGYYYFFSLWPNETDLNRFAESEEFLLINGAFHALGVLDQSLTGNISGAKNFKIQTYNCN
jgi:quinol monooxygenase YgiN